MLLLKCFIPGSRARLPGISFVIYSPNVYCNVGRTNGRCPKGLKSNRNIYKYVFYANIL